VGAPEANVVKGAFVAVWVVVVVAVWVLEVAAV